MDTENASAEDLASLRAAFAHGEPLGWDEVRAFEARHGIVLPEPYRTFIAEICDGPSSFELMPLGAVPFDWGRDRPERVLAEPFPLTEAWIWEDDEDLTDEELDELLHPVFAHGSLVLANDGCGL
jgi:hypothetical protein